MIYHLRHLTSFRYTQPVTFVYNTLHLKPRELPWQTIKSFRLEIEPEPVVLSERIDYFGNSATFFMIQTPHDAMKVLTQSVIEVLPRMPAAQTSIAWDTAQRTMRADTTPNGLDAYQYSFASLYAKPLEKARAYALPSCRPGMSIHAVATELMTRINTDFTFDPKATTVATPVEDVLQNRRGVCQDFAHLMVSCLRSIGLSARYMSGYIQTVPPPGQPRLAGADASHAWVAVYCPQAGWLELDPTNNQAADEQYITLGCGRDFQDVSPAKGVLLGGGKHTVHAQVDMIPETELRPVQSQQQQQQ
ncbi:Protein-glutamine gamma-glutamyltransferase [Pontiella desulfatans]|uniref:Protein-glutamine gamma-glutamyltransferase n=1 Tax=Pontiella desulfatans TaxID=2750659 RepID=A0A6C2TZX2_PONDE|nr:transglutaminase family protein [Pontiella desulfatans]VGO12716.1 Protein-glutamine gamma-glutamyltransferase [Pontiella desulfatans]